MVMEVRLGLLLQVQIHMTTEERLLLEYLIVVIYMLLMQISQVIFQHLQLVVELLPVQQLVALILVEAQ